MKRYLIHKKISIPKYYKILFTTGIIILVSCEKTIDVPVDTNDTTPPIIVWTFINHTQGVEITFPAGNVVYNANMGDEISAKAVASDNGGLKEVEDYVGVSYSCGDAESQSNTSDPLVNPHKVSFNIVNGQSLPSWPVFYNATTMNLNCQSGYNFISGGKAFICKATNAANLQTSSSLRIDANP